MLLNVIASSLYTPSREQGPPRPAVKAPEPAAAGADTGWRAGWHEMQQAVPREVAAQTDGPPAVRVEWKLPAELQQRMAVDVTTKGTFTVSVFQVCTHVMHGFGCCCIQACS